MVMLEIMVMLYMRIEERFEHVYACNFEIHHCILHLNYQSYHSSENMRLRARAHLEYGRRAAFTIFISKWAMYIR